MTNVLITGGHGFLGRNLEAHLSARQDVSVALLTRQDTEAGIREKLLAADVIFHLAGVNRPNQISEYDTGNAEFTRLLCDTLRAGGRSPRIVFSSSVQASLDNPYGRSKAKAEDILKDFGSATGACVRIYRLNNLFGKWCRPNYNSVTATFCHNIARELPIQISDPAYVLELTYVEDVVEAFLKELETPPCAASTYLASTHISLGVLAGRIQAFHAMRATLTLPDFSDPFNRALYATYLSYRTNEEREYQLDIKSDSRGSLAEFIKSSHFGQIFVSRTHPGITRGNHFHHTKTEKFFVVEGEGLIRMRHIDGTEVVEYPVRGSSYQVVDIPPGFTHTITNVGDTEMVTLFWSSEVFDPNSPDTFFVPVDVPATSAVPAGGSS